MSTQNAEELNYSDELSVIERKKNTLEQVLRITHTLNRLLKSLESVSYLSQSCLRLPPTLLRFYKALDNRYHAEPSSVISKYLHDVQDKLQQDFGTLMKIAKLSDFGFRELLFETEKHINVLDIQKSVSEYRRRAQTALSLRLILKERGLAAPPIRVQLDEREFRQIIDGLEAKRELYIDKVIESMSELLNDVEPLLALLGSREDDTATVQLKALRDGLAANIAHLKAGKCIDELPYQYEVVEAGEAHEYTDAVSPDAGSPADNMSDSENGVQQDGLTQDKSMPQETMQSQQDETVVTDSQEKRESDVESGKKNRKPEEPEGSLIRKTLKWLYMPWDAK